MEYYAGDFGMSEKKLYQYILNCSILYLYSLVIGKSKYDILQFVHRHLSSPKAELCEKLKEGIY